MDTLHHLVETILSAVNDKNYPVARDLTQELLNALLEIVIAGQMAEREDWVKRTCEGTPRMAGGYDYARKEAVK